VIGTVVKIGTLEVQGYRDVTYAFCLAGRTYEGKSALDAAAVHSVDSSRKVRLLVDPARPAGHIVLAP
jgi:hypothetical protein